MSLQTTSGNVDWSTQQHARSTVERDIFGDSCVAELENLLL